MANWRKFRPRPYDASKGIQLGALVCLVDFDDKQQQVFLGPDGGSMKLVSGAQFVQVISSKAPLGRAMLDKCEGDEVWTPVALPKQALNETLGKWATAMNQSRKKARSGDSRRQHPLIAASKNQPLREDSWQYQKMFRTSAQPPFAERGRSGKGD